METLRVYGAALSPMSAWQILQGVETLPLRMERHCANALAVAEFLRSASAGQLGQLSGPAGPSAARARREQMRASTARPARRACSPSASRAACAAGVRFIEAAQFMSHLANIGDTRTLIIHPASTTHRQLDDAQQLAAGVLPDMVRHLGRPRAHRRHPLGHRPGARGQRRLSDDA